jgi:hypothetical protein
LTNRTKTTKSAPDTLAGSHRKAAPPKKQIEQEERGMNDLKKALRLYGVTGHITVYNETGAVYVNGKYYGVWNFSRNTFTD